MDELQQEYNQAAPYILTSLIEEMGGIARVNLSRLMTNIKEDKIKKIAMTVEEDCLVMEIFDED